MTQAFEAIPITSARRKNQFVMAARPTAVRKTQEPGSESDQLSKLLDEIGVVRSGSTFADSFEAVHHTGKMLACWYERFLRACQLAYNVQADTQVITPKAMLCSYDMAMSAMPLTDSQRHNLGMMLWEELSAIEQRRARASQQPIPAPPPLPPT